MGFGLAWWQYVLIGLIGGNISFLGIGGAIHYYHYHIKRKQNDQWKMQPGKFLSKRLSRHAALLGTFNMSTAASFFGFLAWGIFEKGWSQIYYDFADYSLGWAFLSVFIAFLFIEASAYYMHAAGHRPWLYKKIHKIHHYYSTPTLFPFTTWAFSITNPTFA